MRTGCRIQCQISEEKIRVPPRNRAIMHKIKKKLVIHRMFPSGCCNSPNTSLVSHAWGSTNWSFELSLRLYSARSYTDVLDRIAELRTYRWAIHSMWWDSSRIGRTAACCVQALPALMDDPHETLKIFARTDCQANADASQVQSNKNIGQEICRSFFLPQDCKRKTFPSREKAPYKLRFIEDRPLVTMEWWNDFEP